MAHEVVLSPSGRSIMVEPGETILEAALRDGMAVNYHCANGTCGDCRAQILEGKIAEHLYHDYIFRGEDRHRPMILMCRARPASDMLLEVREASSVDDIPRQEIVTTVQRCTPIRDDIIELQLRTPRSQTLRFMAGQHVTLHIDGLAPRNKSIASCPCNGRDLMFHFFRSHGDPVTEYIFERLKLRDSIRLEGPFGDFVLRQPHGDKIVFVAYETGFAPIKSLIEHALSLEITAPIKLLWLAHDSLGHYQGNQCRAWRDAISNFHYSLIETSCPLSPEDEAVSRLTRLLRSYLADVGGMDIYIAAPDIVVRAIEPILGDNASRSIHLVHDRMKRY